MLSHIHTCFHTFTRRSFTLELQRRLPGDRVAGTLSFSITSALQSEGSEVIVPAVLSERRDPPTLFSSMSQDSCFSSDDDHSPLICLHGTKGIFQEMSDQQTDDIIPVVIATEQHHGATPASHPLVGRQYSEPPLPSTIRQVLYGSTQRLGAAGGVTGGVTGGGAVDEGPVLLHRHRSMITRGSLPRERDQQEFTRGSFSRKRHSTERKQRDPLPPSKP